MGGPKLMLPFGGKTVLQAVVDGLLEVDIEGILVVLGHRRHEVWASLAGRPVGICVNPQYEQGMFSSVLFGISSLPESADAALIVLGDQPQIKADVVRQVVAGYCDGNRGIVIPTYRGRRGHPALVDLQRYGQEIARLPGDQGLKPVMRGHPDDTLELPVADAGILRDVDTPEDYEGELGRLQQD